jgi:hypothetical protein
MPACYGIVVRAPRPGSTTRRARRLNEPGGTYVYRSMTPTKARLQVLRALAAGKTLQELSRTDEDVRAFWDCLIEGYANHGQITAKGRAFLAEHDRTDDVSAPAKSVAIQYRQVDAIRIFLAPVEGPAEVVEEYVGREGA